MLAEKVLQVLDKQVELARLSSILVKSEFQSAAAAFFGGKGAERDRRYPAAFLRGEVSYFLYQRKPVLVRHAEVRNEQISDRSRGRRPIGEYGADRIKAFNARAVLFKK